MGGGGGWGGGGGGGGVNDCNLHSIVQNSALDLNSSFLKSDYQ